VCGLGRRAPRPAPFVARAPEPAAGFPEVASRLWASRRPVVPGTVAARYLEVRGCALPPTEGDLAWRPDVWHPHEKRPFPALLALVTDAVTGERMTLHQTFLAPDGSGKAPIGMPRLLVKGGEKKGGVVRLWPDEELVYGLCVGEGLETLLSAARGFTPVWACLDAANLGALPVLPGVEALTIVADHDEAGVRGADVCARCWREAGREVRRWMSPTAGDDLNDFVGEAAA
jgi:putative DNA primase/helicase